MDHISDRSPVCLSFLVNNFVPLDPSHVQELDDRKRLLNKNARSKGRNRAVGDGCPCFRIPGPSQLGSPFFCLEVTPSQLAHPGRSRAWVDSPM